MFVVNKPSYYHVVIKIC